MAVVYNKERFLGWYLITLKLQEIVESRLLKKSTYAGKIVPIDEPRPPKSEWVISIEEKLVQGCQDNVPGSWANLSIYRIPRYLKHGEDKDWVPQIVSLGPYHHFEEHLRHMERHKWRCLHRILKHSGQGIGLYLDSVKKVERRARTCYEGRISMSRDEFMEMMVLDWCFVIEMFQGFVQGFGKLGYPPNDPIFSLRGLIVQIRRDMIMLENQIPLFVLDQLLGLQLDDPNQKEGVAKLVIQFFNPLIPEDSLFDKHDKGLEFDPLCKLGKVHCLGVLQRSLPLGLKPPKTKQWWQIRRSLTLCLSECREAGIQIRRSNFPNNWVDIQFRNGILRIPHIEINEGMRSFFLNLIAFEQSHFNCSHHVTSYVIFMNNLINSPEDVRYLCNCGIIEHRLGSDAEVADFFHQLCQEVVFDEQDSYLKDLSMEMDRYCFRSWFDWRVALKLKWNAWRAILENKYFDNPWSTISIIAAFILLALTFTQTFYGVYGYYRPRS